MKMTSAQKFGLFIGGLAIVGLLIFCFVGVFAVSKGSRKVLAAEQLKYNPPSDVVYGQHLVEGRVESMFFTQMSDENLRDFVGHKQLPYTGISFFQTDVRELNLCGDVRSTIKLGATYTFVISDSRKADYDGCYSVYSK